MWSVSYIATYRLTPTAQIRACSCVQHVEFVSETAYVRTKTLHNILQYTVVITFLNQVLLKSAYSNTDIFILQTCTCRDDRRTADLPMCACSCAIRISIGTHRANISNTAEACTRQLTDSKHFIFSSLNHRLCADVTWKTRNYIFRQCSKRTSNEYDFSSRDKHARTFET